MLLRSAIKEVEQREKLEELNKIKSEFLSFASHQVKSPMAVVKGYAELIAEGIENVPEQAKDFARKIKEAVGNLLVLVEEFMDYRRIEENKMEFKFEEVEIVSFIRKIVEDLRILAEEKKLQLTFESNLNEAFVKIDKVRFAQVIQNLIDNAIKYTPQGFVKVSLEKKQNEILISVIDTGIGMSKELQQKLFGQFVRDPSIKREIRGTGLGLYIAKYIVEAHHGKIWAESEGIGKGSRFFVSLPISEFDKV
jgi:signal transduction histidine kinase